MHPTTPDNVSYETPIDILIHEFKNYTICIQKYTNLELGLMVIQAGGATLANVRIPLESIDEIVQLTSALGYFTEENDGHILDRISTLVKADLALIF